ncbi:MAG: sulfatase/phosphatase domain-containing protein [Planctomycetota bacterium]|jgi:arylsulfatase A-like enzyme
MGDVPSAPNIILITIDCWRRDAIRHMPALQGLTASWLKATAISESAWTNWVFAALLASEYHELAYDEEGRVKPSVRSLASVLREQGYGTGAFIGHNPWLLKWREHFAHYWNCGIPADSHGVRPQGSRLARYAGRICRLAALSARCPAREVLARGLQWYQAQSGPRFLWMHLMDAHLPWHPGLRKGLEVGLLRSYSALVAYELQSPWRLAGWAREQIRRLYVKCVENLDQALSEHLGSIPPEDIVIIVGDHGEEFDHGLLRHARLYEECLTVPFCVRWPAASAPPAAFRSGAVRQRDIAPALLRALEVEVPPQWTGDASGEDDVSLLQGGSPEIGRACVGVRTSRWKYIRTYSQKAKRLLAEELYDLQRDPGETNDLAGDPQFREVREELADTLEREQAQKRIRPHVDAKPGVAGVEQHLRDLGYI